MSALVVVCLALAVVAGCGDGDSGDEDAAVTTEARSEVALDEDTGTAEASGIEVLDELPQLQRASTDESIPAIRGSAGLSIEDWLATVNSDVARYWQRVFNEPGYRFPGPSQWIFSRPVRTRCGGRVPADAGPFYCELDQTIFLPVRFFTQEAQRFGDAGVAVIVAHETIIKDQPS